MQEVVIKNTTPILRIFDVQKAKEFYVDFLEYTVDWEHRFEKDFPLYIQISKGDCILHLSEHHADSSPGAAIRIELENIKGFQSKLLAKNYKYARPGIEDTPWNLVELTVHDPFNNRLVFYENIALEKKR
ncbi:glyoxalase superfamily protein [Lederbergia lenta]|nr:glyoxalase superfamily protein [Lederbergia lenta]MCM3109461.1 VOC family protein [Lederbergia lenta]MEC2324774.1 glyoxalase superfamily protein [Lederbergia lenta]